MFNKDALFGRKEETPRNEPRSTHVNVTPSLGGGAPPPVRPQPVEPANLRFADTPAPRAPAPAAAAPARVEEPTGSKLIVGPDIKLKGVEITDCDTLVVEGRVDATLDARILEIAENGVFQGTIAVDQAEIRGRFEGEITVRKQLVIQGTGKVSGKIRYAKIKVEEGAELAGDLAMLDKSTASISVTPKRVANA